MKMQTINRNLQEYIQWGKTISVDPQLMSQLLNQETSIFKLSQPYVEQT
jgi:hypothetical protein